MNLVLLSGGSGQRLWPLSNDIRSKQFIKIFHREDGELESMIQRVYRQIKTVDTDATVTIATSKSQVSAMVLRSVCCSVSMAAGLFPTTAAASLSIKVTASLSRRIPRY